MTEVRGKKITILGAALSGLAAARLLHRNGARVFVSESASVEKKNEASVLLKNENIGHEFGGHTDRALDAEWVVVSPGVPGTIPILKKIRERGIPVYSELEIASRWLKGTVIAVTGSNGKTTTTTLIGEIVKTAGIPAIVAGNIGTPLSDVAESSREDGIAVLEVSSFQAEGLARFRPKIGLLLNLSPDHLDRYESVNDYYLAKKRMFQNQTKDDILIANADDAEVQRLIAGLPSIGWGFSLKNVPRNGATIQGDRIVYYRDGQAESIIGTDAIGIRGNHNRSNAMAAILAAKAAGIPTTAIQKTLREFKGVEHRLEWVRETGGVTYYNDSKATNVDSAYVALESFGSNKIVWIAGGKHKGASYAPLADLIASRVKAMILIGEAAGLIEKELGAITKAVRAGSMKEAVEKSRQLAAPGDVVLLSPACASYDMFQNYEDRGRQFKAAVGDL